jgi:hypothetical protein
MDGAPGNASDGFTATPWDRHSSAPRLLSPTLLIINRVKCHAHNSCVHTTRLARARMSPHHRPTTPVAWHGPPGLKPPPHPHAPHNAHSRASSEISQSAIITSLYDIEHPEVDGKLTRCESIVQKSKATGAKNMGIVLTIAAQVCVGCE